eukprot:TRINITY_DN223_c0_g1_i4.p1 TRINITY_DN223_c0_g1~~TRINITY_DN223_c0_g1_i4.p1  ORF type:complete len:359 (-),score=94.54 TRINITY_DN223_c0_g1_i4:286-1362(-)
MSRRFIVFSVLVALEFALTLALDIDCPVLKQQPPTDDVNTLHPTHIRVVAALGDSITAGFGAVDHYVIDGLFEYRDLSFPIGGKEGAMTVPNILKAVTGNSVVGAPTIRGPPLDLLEWKNHRLRPFNPEFDKLDAGISGGTTNCVPSQIDYIASQMKNDPSIDFENDWKLITLFIGSNNLCEVCHHTNVSYPDVYKKQMHDIIAKVRDDIPRVFLNVIPNLPVTEVYPLIESSEYCIAFHKLIEECSCVVGKDSSDETRALMRERHEEFNNAIFEIENEFSESNSTTFAVRVQPITDKTVMPTLKYLSSLDCFHPSALGHEILSINLWNSMLTPKEKKLHALDFEATVMCPTEDSILQ